MTHLEQKTTEMASAQWLCLNTAAKFKETEKRYKTMSKRVEAMAKTDAELHDKNIRIQQKLSEAEIAKYVDSSQHPTYNFN